MSITVSWDNAEKTVIYYAFDGSWDWDDFDAAFEQSVTMTESVEHYVHIIADLRNSDSLPDGALLYIRRVMRVIPPNRGKIVVLGGGKNVKILMDMATRIYKKIAHRFIVVDDLTDAYVALRIAPNAHRLSEETENTNLPKRRAVSLASIAALFS